MGGLPAYLIGAAAAPDALTKYPAARGHQLSGDRCPIVTLTG